MQADGLLVYSAGAVAPPLQTALNVFDRIEGTESRFVAGKPENLLNAIALNKKGDVMSCGVARAICFEVKIRGDSTSACPWRNTRQHVIPQPAYLP